MPKFSISEKFRSLKTFWEGLGKSSNQDSSSRSQQPGTSGINSRGKNYSSSRNWTKQKKTELQKQINRSEENLSKVNNTSSNSNTEYREPEEDDKAPLASGTTTTKYTFGSVRQKVKHFERKALDMSIGDLTADDEITADGQITSSCMSKAEKAEIFLRQQEEKLSKREKFQSVFFERVDLEAHMLLQKKSDIGLLLPEDDSDNKTETDSITTETNFTTRVTGNGGPSRTLWRNMSEVIEANLLEKLPKKEIEIQEAQFEIITSEASYYKNLQLIINHFYQNPKFDERNSSESVLNTALDKHYLFSNIIDIYDCSSNFLKCLEDIWEKGPLLNSICSVIMSSLPSFNVYSIYCRNFYYQTKTLNKLKEDSKFSEVLTKLERDPMCRFSTLQSFLELPMKRMLSLRLLVEKLADKIDDKKDERYEVTTKTLGAVMKLTRECEQESKMMSEKEGMLKIWNSLNFNKVKKIGSESGRTLVKEGPIKVVNAIPNDQGFVARLLPVKNFVHIYIFSDIILVTKQKSNSNVFQVLKHCKRALVDAERSSQNRQHLLMHFVDDSDGSPQVSLTLETKSTDELERWLQVFKPRDESGDYIYDVTDCPQVRVVKSYKPLQKDDLELEVDDIINVYKKTEEGWYLGSKTDDPTDFRAWFPKEFVKEVENEHTRAKMRKVSFRRKLAMRS